MHRPLLHHAVLSETCALYCRRGLTLRSARTVSSHWLSGRCRGVPCCCASGGSGPYGISGQSATALTSPLAGQYFQPQLIATRCHATQHTRLQCTAQPATCLSICSVVRSAWLRSAKRHSLLLDAPESCPFSARWLWVLHLQASLQATAGQLCAARRPAQLSGACRRERLHWPIFCEPDGGRPLTGQFCWQRGETCCVENSVE